jgi:hypothetical protein
MVFHKPLKPGADYMNHQTKYKILNFVAIVYLRSFVQRSPTAGGVYYESQRSHVRGGHDPQSGGSAKGGNN